MAQHPQVFHFWQDVFLDLKPALVLELGTAMGGFTCGLALTLRNLFGSGPRIVTVDPVPITQRNEGSWFPWKPAPLWFDALGVEQVVGTACDDPTAAQLDQLVSAQSPAIILCDGGNKIYEFGHFALRLKPGDLLAAHDYGGPHWHCDEINPERVAPVVHKLGLTPYQHDEARAVGWLTYRLLR